jgi:inorganic pyrophosphatase
MKHKLAYRTTFHGLPISVENRAGSNRHWYDPEADEHGTTKQLYPYGYVRGTLGLDGDEVDVYLGPEKESDKVFVITQLKRFEFEEIDEQKVMLGFLDADSAKHAYVQHFNQARFFGDMKEMTMDEFKNALEKKKGKLIKSEKLYLKKSMVGSNIPSRPNLYLNPRKV